MGKAQKRMTVGFMMIIIAASGVAIWSVEYSRRIRVAFDNKSSSRIQNVTVNYAGKIRHLGPVEPRSNSAWRIAASPNEAVYVEWDVEERSGKKVRHVTAPGLTASAVGATIQLEFGGK